MKIQKLVDFLYTYSMGIRFILIGSFLFIVELLNMSGHNAAYEPNIPDMRSLSHPQVFIPSKK